MASEGETDPNAPYNDSSLSNLLAYALGVDLLAAGNPEAALPTLSIIDDKGTLSFHVRQGSNPLNYLVEVSADLITWNSGPAHTQTIGSPIDNGDGTLTYTVSALNSGPQQFLRLRVTHP